MFQLGTLADESSVPNSAFEATNKGISDEDERPRLSRKPSQEHGNHPDEFDELLGTLRNVQTALTQEEVAPQVDEFQAKSKFAQRNQNLMAFEAFLQEKKDQGEFIPQFSRSSLWNNSKFLLRNPQNLPQSPYLTSHAYDLTKSMDSSSPISDDMPLLHSSLELDTLYVLNLKLFSIIFKEHPGMTEKMLLTRKLEDTIQQHKELVSNQAILYVGRKIAVRIENYKSLKKQVQQLLAHFHEGNSSPVWNSTVELPNDSFQFQYMAEQDRESILNLINLLKELKEQLTVIRKLRVECQYLFQSIYALESKINEQWEALQKKYTDNKKIFKKLVSTPNLDDMRYSGAVPHPETEIRDAQREKEEWNFVTQLEATLFHVLDPLIQIPVVELPDCPTIAILPQFYSYSWRDVEADCPKEDFLSYSLQTRDDMTEIPIILRIMVEESTITDIPAKTLNRSNFQVQFNESISFALETNMMDSLTIAIASKVPSLPQLTPCNYSRR
jgi:hypothetical protein